MNRPAKFRIYKDVICLETDTPQNVGARFWDQGFGLAFTPVNIREITKVRYGIVRGSGDTAGRRVLAANVQGQWIAINMPRSDIPALQQRGFWPQDITPPYDSVHYTQLPHTLHSI